MPIHDWTRVPSDLFHDFHQTWTIYICRELNAGILPKSLSALVEQKSRPMKLDSSHLDSPAWPLQSQGYAGRANRIVIKRTLARTIAAIEIVSPGNKNDRAAIVNYVSKIIDFLRAEVHVLVVDLFPPTPQDPHGIHKLIWDEMSEDSFSFPVDKDRILASYQAGNEMAAYLEPIALGDKLPDMPLFVGQDKYVLVPLDATYQKAWEGCPEALRKAVETGRLPDPDSEED